MKNYDNQKITSSEFDRFKDFTRRIVKVPKVKINETVKRQEAQQPKLETKRRGSND